MSICFIIFHAAMIIQFVKNPPQICSFVIVKLNKFNFTFEIFQGPISVQIIESFTHSALSVLFLQLRCCVTIIWTFDPLNQTETFIDLNKELSSNDLEFEFTINLTYRSAREICVTWICKC